MNFFDVEMHNISSHKRMLVAQRIKLVVRSVTQGSTDWGENPYSLPHCSLIPSAPEEHINLKSSFANSLVTFHVWDLKNIHYTLAVDGSVSLSTSGTVVTSTYPVLSFAYGDGLIPWLEWRKMQKTTTSACFICRLGNRMRRMHAVDAMFVKNVV